LIDLFVAAKLSARTFVNGQLLPTSYAQLARAESQHDLLLTPAEAP